MAGPKGDKEWRLLTLHDTVFVDIVCARCSSFAVSSHTTSSMETLEGPVEMAYPPVTYAPYPPRASIFSKPRKWKPSRNNGHWPLYSCMLAGHPIDDCICFRELLQKRLNSPHDHTRPIFWRTIKRQILILLARVEDQLEMRAAKAKEKRLRKKEENRKAWRLFAGIFLKDVDDDDSAVALTMQNEKTAAAGEPKSRELLDFEAYKAEMDAEIVALKEDKRILRERNREACRVIGRMTVELDELRHLRERELGIHMFEVLSGVNQGSPTNPSGFRE